MQTTISKRYYSPQFSEMASKRVKRLAWALGCNMVQAVDAFVSFLPQLVDNSKVCLACKDNTIYTACIFSGSHIPQSKLSQIIN